MRLNEIMRNFKRKLFFFHTSDLKKAYGLSAICFGFFVMWRLFRGRSPLNNLFGAAHYIGWLLGTGLPIIIIASLLFCSKLTQSKIASTSINDDGDFVSLYFPYLIITLLVMSIGTIAGFCLIATTSGVFEALLYSPQLLVSTLFLTILVCPICLLLALVLDDKRLSIANGVILFFALTIATGSPGFPVNYHEVAFLGPGILLSAFLFVLIGGVGSYESDWYVGLHFSENQLIIPILVWISISMISTWGARKIYSLNMKRWIAESNQWASAEVGDEGEPSHISTFHDEFKRRRKTAIAFTVAFMLIIPVSAMGYVSVRQQEWTKVVYETPAGGVSLEIGEWLYGAFTGVDAPENIHLAVGCEGEILQGGGSALYVEYTFDHRQMSLNELLQLNETEFEDTFGRSWGRNSGTSTTFHSGRGGPIRDEQYVWVLKLIDVGGQTDGSIRVSFRVVISAT